MCAFFGNRAAPRLSSSSAPFASPRLAIALARRCREISLSWPFGWRFAWIAFFSAARLCPGVRERASLPGTSPSRIGADASASAPRAGDGVVAPGTLSRASPPSPSCDDAVDVGDVAETTGRNRDQRRAWTRRVSDNGVDDVEP